MTTWLDVLKDKRISVVLPVYNEGPQLANNIALVTSEIAPFFREYEIFVADDGSTDGTTEVLKGIRDPHVRRIQHPVNRGKGAILREAFSHATGDYVFFIDGGMELHPKELRIFLALLLIYGADIVIGSKRHPQSEVYYPLPRVLLSRLFQAIVQLLFQLRVTDTQVGLKLMRAEVLRSVLPRMSIDGYGFDLELLVKAKDSGFTRMLEAPVTMDYFARNQRPLPMEALHVFRVGLKVMRDTWALYRSRRRA